MSNDSHKLFRLGFIRQIPHLLDKLFKSESASAICKARRKSFKESVLIFSPNNCFPPCHGSHHRVIQQIKDLSQNYSLYVASSRYTTDSCWPAKLNACLDATSIYGVNGIYLFEDSLEGKTNLLVTAAIRRLRYVIPFLKLDEFRDQIQKWIMTVWFSRLSILLNPRAIIIHYSKWGFLARFAKTQIKALELHDILAINSYLVLETLQALGKSQINCVVPIPWPWYIDNIQQLPADVAAVVKRDICEIRCFDLVWMISRREQNLLQHQGLAAECRVIYPCVSTDVKNLEKTSPPLLPLGPNAFNAYSLLRFMHTVLPIIDKQVLSCAEILVSGSLGDSSYHIDLTPPLIHVGFVDSYLDLLAKSSLMIVPAAVGTGQQVKIFEALAVGTPVLAYHASVPNDVLASNPCIMAAHNDQEFAQYLSDFLCDANMQSQYVLMAAVSSFRQAEIVKSRPYTASLKQATMHSKGHC